MMKPPKLRGEARRGPAPQARAEPANQYFVLVSCRDEKHQVELLERFLGEELACKAILA